MASPPLVAQTTYAELLERCASAAFDEAFAEEGVFTAKTIKERRYWYFQTGTGDARTQRYVGVETPELSERIARHKEARTTSANAARLCLRCAIIQPAASPSGNRRDHRRPGQGGCFSASRRSGRHNCLSDLLSHAGCQTRHR